VTPLDAAGWHHAAAARRRLRPAAWFLLGELVDRGDPVTASSRDLAGVTGLGRDTVRAALGELEAAGLITRTVGRDDAGRYRSVVIHVLGASATQRPEPASTAPATTTNGRRTAPATVDQLSLLDDHPTAP
jgi:DNA-binding MarR family transcriptional regulator